MEEFDIIGDYYQPVVRNVDIPQTHRDWEIQAMIKQFPKCQTVIDLACGDGLYARIARQLGATNVTGVDISAKMIGFAIKQDPQTTWYCCNVLEFQTSEKFDLVIGAFLLCYAKNKSELRTMIQLIKSLGSEFIGLTLNPNYQPECYKETKEQFGFWLDRPEKEEPVVDGSPIDWIWSAAQSRIYWYSEETLKNFFGPGLEFFPIRENSPVIGLKWKMLK
jgi:SAM-dependent methyltransferase